MTCGERVHTPYGSGLIVGFRGWEDAIVSLDEGGYTTLQVPASDRTDVRFPVAGSTHFSYDSVVGSGDESASIARGARLRATTLESGAVAYRSSGPNAA